MKYLIIALVVIVLAGAAYYAFRPHAAVAPSPTPSATSTPAASPTPTPKPVKTPTPTPSAGLGVGASNIQRIAIRNFQFSPSSVTVRVGDVVVFTNYDQVQHTVTSDTGAFAQQTVAPNNEAIIATANMSKGTYGFHCSIHPTMTGTIIIQ